MRTSRLVPLLLVLFAPCALADKPPWAGGGGDRGELPPGLQKKVERGGQLPPGWQKKLRRGYVIEEAIWVHARPVPAAVLMRFPAGEAGTVTVEIGGRIVRLIEATRTIVDVLR